MSSLYDTPAVITKRIQLSDPDTGAYNFFGKLAGDGKGIMSPRYYRNPKGTKKSRPANLYADQSNTGLIEYVNLSHVNTTPLEKAIIDGHDAPANEKGNLDLSATDAVLTPSLAPIYMDYSQRYLTVTIPTMMVTTLNDELVKFWGKVRTDRLDFVFPYADTGTNGICNGDVALAIRCNDKDGAGNFTDDANTFSLSENLANMFMYAGSNGIAGGHKIKPATAKPQTGINTQDVFDQSGLNGGPITLATGDKVLITNSDATYNIVGEGDYSINGLWMIENAGDAATAFVMVRIGLDIDWTYTIWRTTKGQINTLEPNNSLVTSLKKVRAAGDSDRGRYVEMRMPKASLYNKRFQRQEDYLKGSAKYNAGKNWILEVISYSSVDFYEHPDFKIKYGDSRGQLWRVSVLPTEGGAPIPTDASIPFNLNINTSRVISVDDPDFTIKRHVEDGVDLGLIDVFGSKVFYNDQRDMLLEGSFIAVYQDGTAKLEDLDIEIRLELLSIVV